MPCSCTLSAALPRTYKQIYPETDKTYNVSVYECSSMQVGCLPQKKSQKHLTKLDKAKIN